MSIIGFFILKEGKCRTRLKGELEWTSDLYKANIFNRSELDPFKDEKDVVFVPVYANIRPQQPKEEDAT